MTPNVPKVQAVGSGDSMTEPCSVKIELKLSNSSSYEIKLLHLDQPKLSLPTISSDLKKNRFVALYVSS